MSNLSPQTTLDANAPVGRVADAIVDRIQYQILSGELIDNTPLPSERDLMERFAASRTVIREAIATLASRGLVEARPRFRPIVRKPDYDTALHCMDDVVKLLLQETDGIESLFKSRIFVERGLVRDAATSANRQDIASLKKALSDNRDAIRDSRAFYATDVVFHGVLYRIPGNPIFPTLHRAYCAWLSPQWNRMTQSPERNEISFKSHQAIYTSILERDPDAAENAMEIHLRQAWDDLRETFGHPT